VDTPLASPAPPPLVDANLNTPAVEPALPAQSQQTRVEGVLPDGRRFEVPETVSVMRCMTDPRVIAVPSTMVWLATIAFTFSTLWLYTAGVVGTWFFDLQFVVWRLMYNVTLGLLLRWQSNELGFQKWVQENILAHPSRVQILERAVIFGGKDENRKFRVADYPMEFSSWLVWRFLVMVILAHDVASYFLMVIVHWNAPDLLSPLTYVSYALGLALIVFAVWSKADAHRVIGDYAWYWGDFFFLLDKDLVFDGIFQMFPHPMYSVGYLFMYGFALMAQSHAVFYMGVFGHLAQMVFLVLFENPHIDKTYNAMREPTEQERRRDEILYDDRVGVFERNELVTYRHFNPSRSGDVLMLLLVLYTFAMGATSMLPAWVSVLQAVAWRVVLTVGAGYILRSQSLRDGWVALYKGDRREAFISWKRFYNMAVTLTTVSFVASALRLFQWDMWPIETSFQMRLTFLVVGSMMIALTLYVFDGVYEAIGDYGWFYGDFFLHDQVPPSLTYHGIYRYMNNPDSTIGLVGYYGVAICSGNIAMLFLAAFSHACLAAFQYFVETPHMKKLYGTESMRSVGGMRSGLKAQARQLRELVKRRSVEAEKAILRLREELDALTAKRDRLAQRQQELGAVSPGTPQRNR
jgi:phosphatidylethanolamine N-methyltransferase